MPKLTSGSVKSYLQHGMDDSDDHDDCYDDMEMRMRDGMERQPEMSIAVLPPLVYYDSEDGEDVMMHDYHDENDWMKRSAGDSEGVTDHYDGDYCDER